MRRLLIAGAGGHGKVVAETAVQMRCWDDIAFVDDKFPDLQRVYNWPVLGKLQNASGLIDLYQDLAVAVGENNFRLQIIKSFAKQGFNLPVIIHPSAVLSRNLNINEGTVVFAQCVINPGAILGTGCIINTGVIVEHDCLISNGVHLSPGVKLAGEVQVGECSWIGIGACVINRISIGTNAVVGAGAVIINDAPNDVTVVGNPGKVISKREVGNK